MKVPFGDLLDLCSVQQHQMAFPENAARPGPGQRAPSLPIPAFLLLIPVLTFSFHIVDGIGNDFVCVVKWLLPGQ